MTDFGKHDLDLMAFCPHPDDAEITSGGTLIKAADAGLKTGVVDMTRGEMGTRGTPDVRLREADAAAKILGLAVRENLGLRDAFIVPDDATITICASVLRKYRPQTLIIPHWDGVHPDHFNAGRAIFRSCWLAGLPKFEDGRAPWRPAGILYHNSRLQITPDIVVDVTDVWDRKLDATRCYKSQLHNPDSDEPETNIASRAFLPMIEGIHRYFGSLIGVELGEGFALKGPAPVREPWNLFG